MPEMFGSRDVPQIFCGDPVRGVALAGPYYDSLAFCFVEVQNISLMNLQGLHLLNK